MFQAEHNALQHAELSSARRVRRPARGYTLLELLIVIAMVALLATMVGPSFVSAINRNQQQSAIGSVYGMLTAARSEAVAQQQVVSVCASTDQSTCSGTAWEAGWIMFVDDGAGGGPTNANNGVRDGTETLLRVGQRADGSVTIRTRNFLPTNRVTFTEDGLANSRGTFVVCSGDPGQASALILNISGQARMGVDEDNPADGFIDEDDGTEINSCP